MIEIGPMTEYDGAVAAAMGELIKDLSEGYDGAAPARELMEEIIESPWHDILLAFEGEELVAMASMSVVMGAKAARVAYLEDFVVRGDRQGQGIGKLVWMEILAWGRRKQCRRLEFTTSGKGKKQGAVHFYEKRGAVRRETNNFRVEL